MAGNSHIPDAKLIIPPCDFADDEELLGWLEMCRLIGIKAADELDEASAYVYAKLRRYAISEGLGGRAAKATSRAVALPLVRSSESLLRFAGQMRLASRRFEAFVEATEEPTRKPVTDFKVNRARR